MAKDIGFQNQDVLRFVLLLLRKGRENKLINQAQEPRISAVSTIEIKYTYTAKAHAAFMAHI